MGAGMVCGQSPTESYPIAKALLEFAYQQLKAPPAVNRAPAWLHFARCAYLYPAAGYCTNRVGLEIQFALLLW